MLPAPAVVRSVTASVSIPEARWTVRLMNAARRMDVAVSTRARQPDLPLVQTGPTPSPAQPGNPRSTDWPESQLGRGEGKWIK